MKVVYDQEIDSLKTALQEPHYEYLSPFCNLNQLMPEDHTIDICHHVEFLNLDETFDVRGFHYRIDIFVNFEIFNSNSCL